MHRHTVRPCGSKSLERTAQVPPASAFEQYQKARLDGYSIVNALLQLKFEAGIRDISEFEKAIQEELAKEPIQVAPWHNSDPLTHEACRDGMRLAALTFYWDRRHEVLRLSAESV
jgi:hypothetical protein